MTLDATLGAALAARRKVLGLSQEEVAKRLAAAWGLPGINKAAVSDLERGGRKHAASPERIEAWAAALEGWSLADAALVARLLLEGLEGVVKNRLQDCSRR